MIEEYSIIFLFPSPKVIRKGQCGVVGKAWSWVQIPALNMRQLTWPSRGLWRGVPAVLNSERSPGSRVLTALGCSALEGLTHACTAVQWPAGWLRTRPLGRLTSRKGAAAPPHLPSLAWPGIPSVWCFLWIWHCRKPRSILKGSMDKKWFPYMFVLKFLCKNFLEQTS